MSVRVKKLIGAVLLLVFVTIYALLAMWLGAEVINAQHLAVQLIFYVTAGIAWAFPAFAIIKWASKPG